ncbi:MAG: DUF4199 domain-containing protein [Pseudomonadota bacterium]
MFKTAVVWGAPIGAVVIGITVASIAAGGASGGIAEWAGYLVMLLALSLIFIAVRQHRDRRLGGVIRFWPAFGLGVAIAAVAAVVYTLIWEVYLASTDFAFMEQYAASVLEAKRADGLDDAALAIEAAKLDEAINAYKNPALRLAITFSEIFPVGMLVALIVAATLRRPKSP